MNLQITISIPELVYDIQNKTYLTGRSRSTGDNHRQVAMMQANDDEENINQIKRSIGNGFARINAELSEVLDLHVESADNQLKTDETQRSLLLHLPANFSTASSSAIADAIHSYIVANATAEWFMITNKPDAEDYLKIASQNLGLLREALCKRSRPVRKDSEEKS